MKSNIPSHSSHPSPQDHQPDVAGFDITFDADIYEQKDRKRTRVTTGTYPHRQQKLKENEERDMSDHNHDLTRKNNDLRLQLVVVLLALQSKRRQQEKNEQ
jgi:hypothetical protein